MGTNQARDGAGSQSIPDQQRSSVLWNLGRLAVLAHLGRKLGCPEWVACAMRIEQQGAAIAQRTGVSRVLSLDPASEDPVPGLMTS